MQCNLADQSERMLEALYGEADAASMRQWETHVAECAPCRQEWDELRDTRRRLAAWKVPEIGRVPARAYARPSPVWRLAAAAVLLFAAGSGLGLAGVELRRDDRGWSLDVGHARAGEDKFARLLAEQDARHKSELATLAARLSSRPTAATEAADPKPVLDEVRRLIRESETRQGEHTLALVAGYHDRTRFDMMRMAARLSYLDGKTAQNMARSAELVSYMLDAPQQPQR